MEDHFLYKLRNGKLKGNNVNHKPRKTTKRKKEKDIVINSDSQKHLSKLLEKILDLQKNTLACLEKNSIFQEKQTKTMSKINDKLRLINEALSKNFPLFEKISKDKNFKDQGKKKEVKGLSPSDEKELFRTVKDMRNYSKTWNEVAEHLKTKGVPTLTGNGTWSPNLVLYFYKKVLSQTSSI